ncbi:hypothetical protein OFEAOIEE_LOCUS2981 [Methylorubrum extorquens]
MLDPAGKRCGSREHVDGPSPDRHLAGLIDAIVEDIAEPCQLRRQLLRIERLADAQLDMGGVPRLRRGHTLQQRGGGSQDDVRLCPVVGQPAQHARARAHDPARGRSAVEGQAIPFGINSHRPLRRQRPQDRGDFIKAAAIAGHVDQRPRGLRETEQSHRQGSRRNERGDAAIRARILIVSGLGGPGLCHFYSVERLPGSAPRNAARPARGSCSASPSPVSTELPWGPPVREGPAAGSAVPRLDTVASLGDSQATASTRRLDTDAPDVRSRVGERSSQRGYFGRVRSMFHRLKARSPSIVSRPSSWISSGTRSVPKRSRPVRIMKVTKEA